MNWDESQQLLLIEKYLDGALNEEELQSFNQLRSSKPELEADIDFLRQFQKVQPIFGRNRMKQELQMLESELRKSETPSVLDTIKEKFRQNMEQVQLTIDELLTLFQPSPQYAPLLAHASRSEGLAISQPENGIDCSSGQLGFEFTNTSGTPISITIENNHHQTLSTHELAANTQQYVVTLDQMLPGRYYWKLSAGKGEVVIREFFIRKDLMP